jgi:hypothetical protein
MQREEKKNVWKLLILTPIHRDEIRNLKEMTSTQIKFELDQRSTSTVPTRRSNIVERRIMDAAQILDCAGD